MNTRT